MNKIALAIIGTIAAAGLIFGGTAAASALADSTEQESRTELKVPELIEGRYYLNGNPGESLYFEVNGKSIALRGDKDKVSEVYYDFKYENGKDHYETVPDDVLDKWRESAESEALYNMAENEFVVTSFSGKGYDYLIVNNYDKDQYETTGMVTGSGFGFNGTDKISCILGEFTLV